MQQNYLRNYYKAVSRDPSSSYLIGLELGQGIVCLVSTSVDFVTSGNQIFEIGYLKKSCLNDLSVYWLLSGIHLIWKDNPL